MPSEEDEAKPKAARKGCLWKIGIVSLVFVPLLLILINGPIFRKVAAYGIEKAAATQGLTGSVTVSGTILSGFQISGLEFGGGVDGVVRFVRAGEADVAYSVFDLIREGGIGWLEEVRLSDVDVEIVLPEEPGDTEADEAEEESETDGEAEKANVPELIGELLEARFDITNINLSIRKGDQQYRVEGFNLILPPGGEGELSIKRLDLPEAVSRDDLSTDIRVSAEALTLGPLPLFDLIELTSLEVDWADDDVPFLSATVSLSGGVVEASYGKGGAIAADLVEGAVSLGPLLELAGIEDLSTGQVDSLDIEFQGDFGVPATWESSIELGLSDLYWAPARVDLVSVEATIVPGEGEADTFHILAERGDARIDLSGSSSLSGAMSPAGIAFLPVDIEATIDVADIEQVLSDYLPKDGPTIPATGSIEGELEVAFSDKKLVTTHAHLRSKALSYDGVAIDGIRLLADLEAMERLVFDAEIALDEANSVTADGLLDPNTLTYDAKAEVRVSINERLKALLASFGFEKDLEGLVQVDWAGSGNIKEEDHRGSASLEASGVRYAGAEAVDATVDGGYDNLEIRLPSISLTSETLQFRGGLAYADDVFSIPDMQLRSGELLLLEGRMVVPLAPAVLKSPADFFIQEEPIAIDVESHELALDSILRLFKAEPPVACLINLDLEASGSPAALEVAGTFTADDLVVKPGENAAITDKVAPARVGLELAVSDELARVSGLVEQAQINPLRIEGEMPFTPVEWIEGTEDPVRQGLSVSAKMEESELAFLTGFVPGLEEIDGVVGMDFSLTGTLQEPVIFGEANLGVETLILSNKKAPSLRDVKADIRFEDWAVHVDRFDALLAGGQIALKGKVGLPEGAPPDFDLHLGGHEVLVFRSDSVSCRTDIDLRLTGPYTEATLAGTIGLTNSLFYKEIDLLPVGSTGFGTEKSEIPVVEPGPRMPLPKSIDVGVPIEPFSNWNVDVRLVTLDPFRVASNLARAEGYSDLRVGGKLGKPVPNGRVWVERGILTLPFSKIELTEAQITFDETTSFNGLLALRAGAKIGDYQVSVFAQNRVLDPEIVFTSIPPLPREDILSLLASGATRKQLTDGGGTAATKAFLYWLKSLQNKEGRIDPDAPPTFAETIEERTNVSVGGIDTSTGAIQFDATIRLWRESYLGFGTGQENSYRGILKYIFRFR
ncbi:MAG: translocation/assembly module TamB domain-containing protein [Verrucomicrobiota bacterium]